MGGGSPQNPRKTQGKRTPPRPLAPGAPRHQGDQRNPINPVKIQGKHIKTRQNSSRNHQGSSRISQNHFLIDFAKQREAPNNKGTPGNGSRSTNRETRPSDEITHPRTTKISRLDTPPTSDLLEPSYMFRMQMCFEMMQSLFGKIESNILRT